MYSDEDRKIVENVLEKKRVDQRYKPTQEEQAVIDAVLQSDQPAAHRPQHTEGQQESYCIKCKTRKLHSTTLLECITEVECKECNWRMSFSEIHLCNHPSAKKFVK